MPSVFLASRNPILFGCGVSKLTGEKLKEFGCKKVLVVHDKGVKEAGIVDKILGYIHKAGIETVCYGGVLPDPPDYICEEAGALGVAEKVDGVVAIGGGSSLDTGKAAKVLLTNPPPISRYYLKHEDIVPDESNMKPIIVIPTTAGTGSEATPGGVITDTRNNCKQNVPCATNLGIVDPELTFGLPPAVTVTTAIDALCHCVEAYTSKDANQISDVIAKEAISLIGRNLRNVIKNGSDLKAREGVQLAATLAGLSIMGPFCNIPHEIGLVLGMIFQLPHGIACGITLPEALQYLAPAIPDRIKTVAQLLGADVPEDAGSEEIGQIAYTTVRNLYDDIGMPKLKDLVKSKEELAAAVPKIMDYSPFEFSARPVTAKDVFAILEKAYEA
ncbi:MAG: iron-containing alcohol dehydrogenase [Peptococcaceae bacterium]|nr:iron-containing alcohol dehydrogenase [Peptococcaceae bacterium]